MLGVSSCVHPLTKPENRVAGRSLKAILAASRDLETSPRSSPKRCSKARQKAWFARLSNSRRAATDQCSSSCSVDGLRRDRPIQFTLPEMRSPEDAAEATSAIIRAVSEGEISPSEGAALSSMVELWCRTMEVKEIHRNRKEQQELERERRNDATQSHRRIRLLD